MNQRNLDVNILHVQMPSQWSSLWRLDSLYFKGDKLEISSYLDSDCKSSDVIIYSD